MALTGTAETSRLSPRNGFTVYTCSPRGAAFLAPVACWDLPASVAPGSRRQDHTTSPYAANVSSGSRSCLTPQASIATRATLRDERVSSLMAARANREYSSDLRNCQEDIRKNRKVALKPDSRLIHGKIVPRLDGKPPSPTIGVAPCSSHPVIISPN